MVHQGRQFLKHVVPAVMKPLRTLWNEIISFLFVILAIPFLFKGYQIDPEVRREHRRRPQRRHVRLSYPADGVLRHFLVPAGAQNLPVMSDASRPGEFPYTRGIYPDMYRSRLWTMRQYAGFGDAEESNRRYRYLISQGATGLSVAFDLPTQMGMDSDHPLAAGEVGRVGVAISSLADMERLFQDIRLDHVSTSMTINSTASYPAGLLRAGGASGKARTCASFRARSRTTF